MVLLPVARDMLHSFPDIRIGLLVGIGGGAPRALDDIRLGDVVVSVPKKGTDGVYQYDRGKAIQDQSFTCTGFLNRPPNLVLNAVGNLKSQLDEDGYNLKEKVDTRLKGEKKATKEIQSARWVV